MNIFRWVLRVVAATILLQTLYFKFTAAPESVYIFTKVGAEPYGRIGSGIFELVASGLLLVPSLSVFGALLAVGVMSGAILSHLTILGIDVLDDHGLLFGMACVVWVACAILVWDGRARLISFVRTRLGRSAG
jgi:uncharacterized membrane protein YphA (DoxX/SURF4 family)